MRVFAVLFILSVVIDIFFIVQALVLHKTTFVYQGLLASATAATGLLSLGIRELLPRNRDQINLREITRNLNRSRQSLIREEISAALFRHHNPPIDIKLALLKTSSITLPQHLMRFMSCKELFLKIPYGRMSIIGPPGAGKSLMVQQFLLEVSSDQNKEDSWIPIIIPAQNWDPRASNLDYWLTRQASSILDIDKTVAWSLLDAAIILPIFDGLDEMDPIPDEPSNAKEFIKSLNNWNRRFVVTCRTDTWNFLEGAGYILEDACNVQLEPLTSRQVTDYLELRNRSNSQGVTTRNTIKKLSRTLGSTLSTPFDLALIGSLLSRNGSIDKLMQRISYNMPADQIEAELLAAFIEARAQWYSKRTRANRKHASTWSSNPPLLFD